MNKKIIATSVLIAILVVGAFAGTIFYYNSKIANLNSQISNLKSQLTNLTGQLTNLTSANLVATLTVIETPKGNTTPYSMLYIAGYVNNTGRVTAYNAGLHIVAYNATGTLEINMTFPLDYEETFGTDNATDNYVSSILLGGSLQLGSLGSGQSLPIFLDIFHEGIVSKWTVTPVWTNSP